MAESINWEALAIQVGALTNGSESGDRLYAQRAIEILLGEDNLRHAVDYYILGKPGSELARFVLWQIHPWSAMEHCYGIYKSDAEIEVRRLAVELLRVVADQRALEWVDEFLEDEDSDIQIWGAGLLDQLLHSWLIDAKEAEGLLVKAEMHANPNVRETAKSIRDYLSRREYLEAGNNQKGGEVA